MNSFSNIEIVNFDNFENEDEFNQFNFNLDPNCEMNFISNFITDRYETDYSDNFPDNRSCSAFSDFGLQSYSLNNSVLADQLNFADNFKSLNLNDSLSQCDKDCAHSFSYKPSESKNILIGKNSNGAHSFESSYDLENLEFECVGKNVVLVDHDDVQTKKWIDFNRKKRSESSNNLKGKMKDVKETTGNVKDYFGEAKEKEGKKEKLKLFKCTYQNCMKAYKSKENLTLHFKNIHLKEKPYTCKYCKATFSHRNGKTYHERKFHTRFLPHKCNFEQCELSFASKSALSYHIKSHHTQKTCRKISRMNKSKFNEKILQMVSQPFC